VEIRQLRYFISTLRHGSLRAAAREHFITQPAVSIQLKKLEDELGEKLYVRRGRRIEPTQAGALVLAGAEEIVRRASTFSPACFASSASGTRESMSR
jgi:DNA-binding transcriptional LysR family regulator